MPSLTEDLFAIGAGPQVVGVSAFTDYPPAARRVTQVASFASVDAERIVTLQPDVVVGIPAEGPLVADVRRLGVRVVLIPDDSFDDIFSALRRLGDLSGHRAEADKLVSRLRERTDKIVSGVRGKARPRVFVVLGAAPIFTVGDRSYIAHLIGLAGGRNAPVDMREPYGRYSAEALVALQPDAIVADRASGLDSVIGAPPWTSLRAVAAHRVYVLREAAILERPGPRYNEGLAWLAARLHGRGT